MVEAPATKLDPILRLAIELNATDIHVQVGLPPMFRVRGKLVAHQSEPLSAHHCEALVFSIMSEDQKKTFSERLDCDFSHGITGLARFRINVFRQRASVAAAFRRIPYQIPAMEQLGLPSSVLELTRLKRGLILVTGATGQGKSTTLASVLDRMNQERQLHIVTLEDPIEYLFEHKSSIVGPREVGIDTLSFASAPRACLREDPVVLTQQLIPRRDDEGMALAMEMLMIIPAIRNLIREAKTFQIQSLLQTGASSGMLTMEQSLKGLVDKRWISADDALESCFDPKEMARLLGRK